MASTQQGAIAFGLVYIPVKLYTTTIDNSISFNQLCKQTKERVRYKKFCAGCDKELSSSDILKGYQYEKDQYIILKDEEIEALKKEKDRTIHILHFTPLSNIEDIYFEKNYYAIPNKHAEKAYELLRNAMMTSKVVGIAKSIIGNKETLLALCPKEECILVKTLFYEEEIAEMPTQIKKTKLSKVENDMAKQLVKSMTQPFDATLYHDEFQDKLREMIEHKLSGKNVTKVTTREQTTSPVDLMEALTQSITNLNATELRH